MDKKFYIEILGCPKAVYDCEVITGKLINSGYEFVSESEKRDWTIIFTCGFLENSRNESNQIIEKYLNDKKAGKLIVLGCYAQLFQKQLRERFPDVYAFSGVNDYNKIIDIIKNGKTIISKSREKQGWGFPKTILTGRFWDYVKISEGCSHSCSFCIIPKIRGDYISNSMESIKKELETLNEFGIKEIVLISQDTSFYGIDKGKQKLVNLLDAIDKNYGFHWIRVMYLNPMHITDDIIKRIGKGKVLPYFDIPFQHSSGKILKLMKRGGSGKDFLRIIDKIRKYHPKSFIRSTLITGFPGENEEDFKELVAFVRAAEINHLGVFTYSDEKFADSYKLKNKVDKVKGEERKNIIYEIQNEIFNNKLKKLTGKNFEMINEYQMGNSKILGRLWFQAPEGIDGSAMLISNKPIKIKKPILDVKITGFDFNSMSYTVK
jgi:ribosomal protein S12 methylthiotransferase